ncbi:hypothetical protein CDAR_43281 [Caerostris darwini]|uniref:Uncharacterized protein n=1 Tax=Caerostris darwini TaxID=1538125 RepID=A0AAV4WGH5_9ARAC|nr:hypothetical protein CDAR_43281 [Caerostris darwini]
MSIGLGLFSMPDARADIVSSASIYMGVFIDMNGGFPPCILPCGKTDSTVRLPLEVDMFGHAQLCDIIAQCGNVDKNGCRTIHLNFPTACELRFSEQPLVTCVFLIASVSALRLEKSLLRPISRCVGGARGGGMPLT